MGWIAITCGKKSVEATTSSTLHACAASLWSTRPQLYQRKGSCEVESEDIELGWGIMHEAHKFQLVCEVEAQIKDRAGVFPPFDELGSLAKLLSRRKNPGRPGNGRVIQTA